MVLRLKEIIAEVCKQTATELIELETMPDHVHLLVGIDPQFGIHRLVKTIKGRSSRLLRQEFPSLCSRLPTLWTHSYFVAALRSRSSSRTWPTSAAPERSAISPLRGEWGSASPRLKPGASRPTPHPGDYRREAQDIDRGRLRQS